MASRLKEIDALRGLAVFLMIFYHALYDLNWIGGFGWNFSNSLFTGLARTGQFLFLGLVGVSVFLSERGFKAQVQRGLRIFLWGLLITGISWLFFPEFYVRFGVLHFIGVSVPLLNLFKKNPWIALIFAPLTYILGIWLETLNWRQPWGIPFGVVPLDFSTFDYFPIFPWLAVPMFGLWFASFFYAKRRTNAFVFLERFPGLLWLGRHSLAVYLLHLPLVYFTVWMLLYWIQA